MSGFSEQVLVLQLGKFKEADLWVRFLSPTRGLLSAFAFGGSRSRRRFVGCLDLFNEIHVRVNSEKTGRYLSLQEGVLIRGLQRLRRDWARLGMAVNCARFLQCFGIGEEGAGKAHHLFQELLQLLEADPEPPRMLPVYFRARLAFDQGYALESGACARCGRDFTSRFDRDAFLLLREGRLLCRSCAAGASGHGMMLGPDALEMFALLQNEPPKAWGCLDLSRTGARQCALAIDGFIQYHVGVSWHEGRFIRR